MNITGKVIISGACRTPIGKMGGALSKIPAAELGAIVIKEALKRANVPSDRVDQVYMGCVIQAGLGQNVARQAAVKAGVKVEAPAVTINVVCGSGLHAVNLAAMLIESGNADVVVAGGTENMSMAPYALRDARYGYKMGNGEMIDCMVNDALTDSFNNYHMGITAENVAEKYGLTRAELDDFALKSQNKAERAMERGVFKAEIVPVVVKERKNSFEFAEDESPRTGMTIENLKRLRPAFKPDGIVTAGNSSSINDGAAAVVLMSEAAAEKYGSKVMGYWKGGALAGVEPEIMGIGPVASTKKALYKAGLSVADLDLIEANEAFAAQSIAVIRDLGLPGDIVNVNGGAIALGHPVGASGCRILVSLLHEMERRNVKTGLATLCVGGGMGCSTIIER